MALVMVGVTPCVICQEVIKKGQDYVAFPPFVPNKRDPLIIFNDAACHQSCFTNHPLFAAAQARLAQVNTLRKRPRLCTVCGLEINDPDDFFLLAHWTDDPHSKLFQFNDLQFHLSHLSQWPQLRVFCDLLLDLEISGTWEGLTLPYIIEKVRAALSSEQVQKP